MKKIESGKLNRYALEFFVIAGGILVALAVDDWRQSRADLATERYILEEILADLDRDRQDVERTILAAYRRAAGADKLLAEIRGTGAGQALPPHEESILEQVRLRYPPSSLSVNSAFGFLTAASSIQLFNVSVATFTEASGSGDMNKIRDVSLRAEMADYYYNSSIVGSDIEQRINDQWMHLRYTLARSGLPSGTLAPEEDILLMLRSADAPFAEIANAREFAIDQINTNTNVLDSVNDLMMSVTAALQGD